MTISLDYRVKNRLYLEYLLNHSLSNSTKVDTGIDVIKGLNKTQKCLPARYFYDERGSHLFELICELPEYYVTRTEATILLNCATDIASLTGPCELVELGSGSSTKTRILLDAYQQLNYPLRYLPIDVSPSILESSAYQLLDDYDSLQIHGMIATYEMALAKLSPSPLQSRMICFLGSSLGNLNPHECEVFFSQIVGALEPGQYFLLGIDLHKHKEILEPAYDDSKGVTAAFNLNMLNHLNHLFEGNFDTGKFEHLAFYNDTDYQIEMHLKSKQLQRVELGKINLTIELEKGETIRSEISRKFHLQQMQAELEKRGLVTVQVWTDSQQWFGVLLCQLRD
jgi:L-histidine Nalpha-methyltransferase